MRKAFDLYDHQWDAVNKLRSGSILCGGVGSGKSRTALAYFYMKECGGSLFLEKHSPIDIFSNPMDLYIITTARKRDSLEWEKECGYFRLSTHREDSMGEILVTIDSWNNIKKYENVKDCFFIFDEQRVVGKGAWVKSFLKITKSNRWILLSATPGDTWSDYIPVFIANGFYKNRTEFLGRHAVYNRASKFPKIDRYIEQAPLIKYRNQILVDMPFERETIQHHESVSCSYDKSLYDSVMRTRMNPYTNEPIQDAGSLCYILREVVNSDPSRILSVIELYEKHHKVIVFYNYDYELELLRKIPVDIFEWNGHKHDPVPHDLDEWLYLVQYNAGAEGWNCIETDTIIFFSQSYSYKVMVQAAGRIDRMNTPFLHLYYYHFKSLSSIDRAISRALKNKKAFNERSFVSF